MNEWKSLNGRITLFLTPSSSPSVLEIYREIWDSEPDAFQRQANVLAPTVASGRRKGLVVNCTVQPIRIDFNLSAAPTHDPPITVALIDHPIELLNELKHIIDMLGTSIPSIEVQRVALNLQFFNRNPSHQEANKVVTETIPDEYGVTLTSEEDFLFQINQAKMSRDIKDIKMNFITRWSVEKFQVLAIPIPTSGVTMGITSLPPETIIAARVSFDNNNYPSRILSREHQIALLKEALDAAVEMQRKIGINIEGF